MSSIDPGTVDPAPAPEIPPRAANTAPPPPRIVRIIHHHYNDATARNVPSGIIPYRNDHWTKYVSFATDLELRARNAHVGCDYFGILSWKLPYKTGITHATVKRCIETDAHAPDFYYLPLPQFRQRVNPWTHGEHFHPGITRLAEKVFAKAGLDPALFDLVCVPAFCMYFVTTPSNYAAYVDTFLRPCIEAMKQPELDRELSDPIPYAGNTMTLEERVKTFGVKGPTFHPVILERLWPTFAAFHHLSHGEIAGRPRVAPSP